MPIKMKELRARQALSLDEKVALSLEKIKTWFEYWEGKVYVAFSGGKDSTVLLHLVRSLYPDVPGMFADTGLEYPEIRDFVKTFDNITWVRPKISFKKVLEKYGYPVVSKEIAMAVERYHSAKTEKARTYRLMGGKKGERSGIIGKRWRILVNAPFKISGQCCSVMKKQPAKIYQRKTEAFPMLGMMADNSRYRQQVYLQHNGCHMLDLKAPKSWPLAFWKDQDVWLYLRKYDVPYCKIYDMGYERTGCMFCMFGVQMEKSPNRFQRMAKTHPKQYRYCMDNLGLRDVLRFLNVPHKPFTQGRLEDYLADVSDQPIKGNDP